MPLNSECMQLLNSLIGDVETLEVNVVVFFLSVTKSCILKM